jgi:Domain of unknown function (DUF4372)
MYAGQLVFAQLMDFLPRHEFNACVRRYDGDRRSRGFSCRDQFLCLAFAQLTFRESLRDIETCLRAVPSKLYHAGFRGAISRSTLADANRVHDWRIYADFAQAPISHARKLYANEPLSTMLAETVYALDSMTIDLCLRASFRGPDSAVARERSSCTRCSTCPGCVGFSTASSPTAFTASSYSALIASFTLWMSAKSRK